MAVAATLCFPHRPVSDRWLLSWGLLRSFQGYVVAIGPLFLSVAAKECC